MAVTQHFRNYLIYAAVVETYTDSNLLVYVLSTAEMNATGQRWANELADSNLNIHYNPGRNHIDEDYLSRFPQDKREYTHRSFKKEMKDRGGSRTAATSKMERFVIIVNGF